MSDNLGVEDFAINLVYILFSTCLTGKWRFLVKLKFKETEVDYSVGDTAAAQKKKPRLLPLGVEPMTKLWLLVQML